ncbi:hypothetical protein ACLOJK_032201 [Asimina triloba]
MDEVLGRPDLMDNPLDKKAIQEVLNISRSRLSGGSKEWGVSTTWQADLEKPRVTTSVQKGQGVVFKAMTSFFKEENLNQHAPLPRSLSSKDLMKEEPLEGDVVLERFVLTMEEVTELELRERGRMGVADDMTSGEETVAIVETTVSDMIEALNVRLLRFIALKLKQTKLGDSKARAQATKVEAEIRRPHVTPEKGGEYEPIKKLVEQSPQEMRPRPKATPQRSKWKGSLGMAKKPLTRGPTAAKPQGRS